MDVMDAFAFEPQFLDHLAPVWRLLQPPHRGRLFVDDALLLRAHQLGISDAIGISGAEIRRGSRAPTADILDQSGPIAFVASIGDTKIARRLGYRRFVFIEHGCGQSYGGDPRSISARNPSYAGGDDRDDTELVLVPNDYAAQAWRRRYPSKPVEVIGSPRLASLPRRGTSLAGPVVAFSFHWPAFVAPEAGTALGHYALTLKSVAARFATVGHGHPKGDWPARVSRYYQRAGIPFVPEFDEVCRIADVYVCDNSSTMFEFAATGRPVVVLNSPMYRRNVNHGGRFWDWATVGVQVDQPDELIPAIDRALADPPDVRLERERVVRAVFAHIDGAAERAAGCISEWLANHREVAA